MRPFVIGGTARHGSQYIAKLLQHCGVNCIHEGIALYWGENFSFNPQWLRLGGCHGESSFLTTPFYEQYREAGFVCLHQMRDAINCIDALKRGGHFTKGWPVDSFITTHCPILQQYADNKLIHEMYYTYWNNMGIKSADLTYFVEQISVDKKLLRNIFDLIEYDCPGDIIEYAINITPTKTNTKKHEHPV